MQQTTVGSVIVLRAIRSENTRWRSLSIDLSASKATSIRTASSHWDHSSCSLKRHSKFCKFCKQTNHDKNHCCALDKIIEENDDDSHLHHRTSDRQSSTPQSSKPKDPSRFKSSTKAGKTSVVSLEASESSSSLSSDDDLPRARGAVVEHANSVRSGGFDWNIDSGCSASMSPTSHSL